ncbi:hypothetical protein [Plantactinospora sonchi]|uniref:Tetratricopeptide repeat protein n=1 Tax=Plantactinospora sonchi TaxID=1544735 RepID=A0ABU7S3W7_9ACTN
MPDDVDDMLASIIEAVEWGRAGRVDEARERLTELWGRIGPDGDPLHRCSLAHYLADLQDDPAEELRWDLRALDAADVLTDVRAQRHHSALTVEGMRPSLHLNLADDYRKLGRPDEAREHLALARHAVPVLPDDDYGRLVRGGIARLAEELGVPA